MMYKYTTFALQLEHIILKNNYGFKAEILNYGATLWKLWIPGKTGTPVNVVIGLREVDDYTSDYYKALNFCLGATIGRYAGRISKGGFKVHDTFYPLQNEITLHGGSNGLDKQYWHVVSQTQTRVVLSLKDREGNHGFPGNLNVFASYELLDNGLRVFYKATTDIDTVLNLTNHAYFNLNGEGNVLNHQLTIKGTHLCHTDAQLVPSGKLIPISETNYDYRLSKTLDFLQDTSLDTPFLVAEDEISKGTLYSPKTGIEMQVQTNQPALVLYTPKSLEKLVLDGNYSNYPAICFECQNLPDAPNQKHFPNAILKQGETYKNESFFSFKIR